MDKSNRKSKCTSKLHRNFKLWSTTANHLPKCYEGIGLKIFLLVQPILASPVHWSTRCYECFNLMIQTKIRCTVQTHINFCLSRRISKCTYSTLNIVIFVKIRLVNDRKRAFFFGALRLELFYEFTPPENRAGAKFLFVRRVTNNHVFAKPSNRNDNNSIKSIHCY